MNKLLNSLQQLYSNKQILILGLGKEGISTQKTLAALFPNQKIATMDKSNSTDYLQNLGQYQVIFKTPSLPIDDPALIDFQKNGGVITSQLNEFLRVYKNQTVGVTGTKGKSTTTTFIYQLLLESGKNAVIAGNMGIPPFETSDQIEENTLIAVEMSSYQLQSVEFSPHWAVWLNVFQEHLNFHGNLDNYTLAKAKITLHQSEEDIFIFNEADQIISKFATSSKAIKYSFKPAHSMEDFPLRLSETNTTQLSQVFLTNDLPAVLQLSKVMKIDEATILNTIKNFKSLPHRLEKISSPSGRVFIDDTLATIPEAAAAAIDAFPNVQVMLLGGFDRGIEYELIVEKIVQSKIPVLIFFKPSGEKMLKLLNQKTSDQYFPKTFLVDSMQEAVQLSIEHSQHGDVILLSPASPSFGQFKDYQDKSDQFRHWILELDSA